MRTKVFNRVISVFLSSILLCASVPAQLEFGGRGLGTTATPHLRSQTRLRIGLRRPSFVLRVGGVAFDGVATPASDLSIRQLGLNYRQNNKDGDRLELTLNGERIAAPIYDWQLIPIAKFADSNDVACFTLTGDFDLSEQDEFSLSHTQYQESFQNEFLGVRLFQLDRFFFDEHYWDLVKKDGKYLLAAGETMPDFEANKKAHTEFRVFKEQQEDISGGAESYIISDYNRNITFNVHNQQLEIAGEPFVYFWELNEDAFDDLESGRTESLVRKKLATEPRRRNRAWLIREIAEEQNQYMEVIGSSPDIGGERSPKLLDVLLPDPPYLDKPLLNTMRIADLVDVLVELRTFNSLDWVSEVKPLSEAVSKETQRIRAMNPPVWDAGVVLLRYAAFFRFIKNSYPQEWKKFTAQIKLAPPTTPKVQTPTSFRW
jgi:hypothetical protein